MAKDHSGPVHPTPWTNDGDLNVHAPNGMVVPPGGTVMLEGITVRDHVSIEVFKQLVLSAEGEGQPIDFEHLATVSFAAADSWFAARAYYYGRKP